MQPLQYFGIWAQPTASFPKWKALGANVIFPDTTEPLTGLQRRAAAEAAGLMVIDTPYGSTPAEMAADMQNMLFDPNVIAIYSSDEPDLNAPFFTNAGSFSAFVSAWQAKWAPLMLMAKGKKPVFLNVAGPHVMEARPDDLKASEVIPFLQAVNADWVSSDIYPINTNAVANWDQWNQGIGLPKTGYAANAPTDPLAIGSTQQTFTLRILKQNDPGKQYWAFIETCKFDTNLNGRAPTPAEIQKQVDALLVDGVIGICAFVDNLAGPGWSLPGGGPGQSNWDGNTTLEEQALGKAIVAALGTTPSAPIVQSQIDSLSARITALEAKKIPTGAVLVY